MYLCCGSKFPSVIKMNQMYAEMEMECVLNSLIKTKEKIEKSLDRRDYFVEIEARFGKIAPHIFDSIATDSEELNTTEKLYEIKNKRNVVLKEIASNSSSSEDFSIFLLKEEISSNYIALSPDTKVKLVLSIERIYHDTNNKVFLMTRHKTRTSKEEPGYRIDKTRIVDSDDGKESHELELEVTKTDVNVKELVEAVKSIQKTIEQYTSIKQLIKSIVPGIDLDAYKFQKPIDVSIRDIRYKFGIGGSIGYKLDGVRKFVVTVNDKIYSISTSGEEKLIYGIADGNIIEAKKMSLYDSEYVGDQYYIFDTIIQSGKDVSNEGLVKRISYIPGMCIRTNTRVQKQLFVVKPHFIFRDFNGFKEIHKIVLRKMKNLSCDGIIYTSIGGYFNTVFRWKSRRTFDFAFASGTLKLYSKGKLVDSDFILQNTESHIIPSGSIIECYVEKPESKNNKGKAFFIRPRPDKKFPNTYELVKKSAKFVGDEERLLNSFLGKSVYFLRSYHNDVKRELLEAGSGILLDIGSGRGGDLSKWGAYDKVFCIEPSKENIVELNNRLENRPSNTKPKIKVVNSNIENLCKNYPDILNEHITTFSAMFSLNLVELDKMINVINTISSDDCLFVCTVMSKKYIKHIFNNIGKDSFYCESYFMRLRKNTLNINVKDTMVKDQTESLLDVDNFVEKMGAIGFVNKSRRRMLGEFFMSDDEYLLSSMYESLVFVKKSSS
jgi:hypothetical protein